MFANVRERKHTRRNYFRGAAWPGKYRRKELDISSRAGNMAGAIRVARILVQVLTPPENRD